MRAKPGLYGLDTQSKACPTLFLCDEPSGEKKKSGIQREPPKGDEHFFSLK